MKLTDFEVKRALPQGKKYILYDQKGFGIVVEKNGIKGGSTVTLDPVEKETLFQSTTGGYQVSSGS